MHVDKSHDKLLGVLIAFLARTLACYRSALVQYGLYTPVAAWAMSMLRMLSLGRSKIFRT